MYNFLTSIFILQVTITYHVHIAHMGIVNALKPFRGPDIRFGGGIFLFKQQRFGFRVWLVAMLGTTAKKKFSTY